MTKVVIMEDDSLLRKMYSDKLEKAGYKIYVYGDGKSGYKAIKKLKPTMVLSDIMMPVMSGLKVLEEMKKDEELKNIPFVFLTNLSRSDEDIERGLELGAVGYLVKSDLTPDEIVARIKEYVDAHRDMEELPERADERLDRAKRTA